VNIRVKLVWLLLDYCLFGIPEDEDYQVPDSVKEAFLPIESVKDDPEALKLLSALSRLVDLAEKRTAPEDDAEASIVRLMNFVVDIQDGEARAYLPHVAPDYIEPNPEVRNKDWQFEAAREVAHSLGCKLTQGISEQYFKLLVGEWAYLIYKDTGRIVKDKNATAKFPALKMESGDWDLIDVVRKAVNLKNRAPERDEQSGYPGYDRAYRNNSRRR
jgi:hypothetical protein